MAAMRRRAPAAATGRPAAVENRTRKHGVLPRLAPLRATQGGKRRGVNARRRWNAGDGTGKRRRVNAKPPNAAWIARAGLHRGGAALSHFGWSPRRRAALALLVRDGPPWLGLDAVAAAVGVSRRTLYRWRCAPAFAAAVDAAHRARAKLWEAAWLAAADRRHDEAVAKVLRRVRRAR